MLTIGQLNKKAELEALLNNTVDDDEAGDCFSGSWQERR